MSLFKSVQNIFNAIITNNITKATKEDIIRLHFVFKSIFEFEEYFAAEASKEFLEQTPADPDIFKFNPNPVPLHNNNPPNLNHLNNSSNSMNDATPNNLPTNDKKAVQNNSINGTRNNKNTKKVETKQPRKTQLNETMSKQVSNDIQNCFIAKTDADLEISINAFGYLDMDKLDSILKCFFEFKTIEASGRITIEIESGGKVIKNLEGKNDLYSKIITFVKSLQFYLNHLCEQGATFTKIDINRVFDKLRKNNPKFFND